MARAEHRSSDFCPKTVQNCLKIIASTPEGPVDPSAWRAENLISSVDMLSISIAWKLFPATFVLFRRAPGWEGLSSGYFSCRTSLTVLPLAVIWTRLR